MYRTRLHFLLSRAFSVAALLSLLLAGVGPQDSSWASAQEPAATSQQPGIRPLAADGSLYYYADGERLPLKMSLDWVSVKFSSDNPVAQFAALVASGAPVNALEQPRTIPNPPLTLVRLQSGITVGDVVQGINAMRARPDSFQAVDPVFQTFDAEMAITDQFIATFPAGTTREQIKALNALHGVSIKEPLLGQPDTYILKVGAGSHLDSLAMANLYQESGIALDAAPDFVRILNEEPYQTGAHKASSVGPMAAPNDYWYYDQWALNNVQQFGTGMKYDADIDAPEAWDVTTGSSAITIAVIDEGVELTQEDLSAKMITGYDATGGGSAGGPCSAPCGNEDDAHGTNVAGLAAASSNNTIGIAGVCQQCLIMPIRIAYGSGGYWITYDSWIANGITWAYQHGADVLNNSWGGGSPSTAINTAISNARSLGRSGKGSVVVFAAGNDNSSSVSYPGSLSSVIGVAASNMCDRRKAPTNTYCNGFEAWGSNYGTALDVSAPGVWLDSTDRMGIYGYSSGGFYGANYFGSMNGTSGAAPIVSGVAGLILSVNPALSPAQVQNILQITADDTDGGGWGTQMGYGRVNANRAVLVTSSASLPALSAGAADGWLLQSSEGSTTASSLNSTAITFNLGDDALNRQYRSILSFNTTLPVGAKITGVTLKIKMASTTGSNPFATMGNIVADIKTGTFGTSSLQLGDFPALPSVKAAITIPNKPASGIYTGILPPKLYGYINTAGITQFRLRFGTSDNNNHVADYMSFYSGNYKATGYRPTLTIFYLP